MIKDEDAHGRGSNRGPGGPGGPPHLGPPPGGPGGSGMGQDKGNHDGQGPHSGPGF
jgi:hypothetical protein